MKKKVLKSVLPILCVAFTVAGFAACKDGEEHVHTYSTEWSKDAEGHWYDVTCDCADAPENPKLQHVDKNNDSLCDICEYDYGHAHTYETATWTVNCEQHWRAATCGHVVVGTEVGDHADTNGDGKCDTCNYVIEDIHEHVFDDEWTSDGEYHWYAALCEHKDEIDGKEAHNLNAAGDCTVCGAHVNDVDATNIAAVLAAAADKAYMVIDGKVAYENTVYDGVAGSYTVGNWTDQDIYYVLGNNASYRTETITNAIGTTIDQYWFELANPEDDKLFCLQLAGDATELVMLEGPMYALNGYSYYPGSILKDLDAPKLEDAILGLYNILVANTHISNAASNYDADTGVYSFSYSYFTVNATSGSETAGGTGDATTDGDTSDNTMSYEAELYEVAVEFTVDANFVLNWVDFSVTGYRDTAIDDDINYDPTTDTVTKNAGANPTVYAYVVTQTSGERTYTTPYPKASVVPTDFELVYVTETERDDNYNRVPVATAAIENNALTFDAGLNELLAIGKIYPVSSNPAFFNGDDIQVSMVSKDDPNVTCYAYYGWQYMTIGFYTKPGNWTLTVTCGEIVKVIDVTVNPAKATDISAQVFAWESGWWGDEYTPSSASTITVKEGETFDFTAVVSPDLASQEYTYSLDKATGATITEVTLEGVTVNYEYFETYKAYQFKADVAGTYVITVKDKDNLVSATLTVTVLKLGTINAPYELTEPGTYSCAFPGGYDCVWYTYTPSAGGYLTVSTTFGENGWLQAGTDRMALATNGGSGESVKTYVKANTICYIGVGDYSEVESTVPFTVAFEEGDPIPDGTATLPYALELEKENSCAFPGGYNYVFYSYTAVSVGTLTVTMTSSDYYWAYGSGQWEMNNVGASTPSADITLAAGETVLIGISTNTAAEATVTFTASFVVGTTGGEEVSATDLVIGNNAINAADVTYAYTATEAGTLNLAAGGAVMGMVEIFYTVNGGESTVLELSSNVDLTLAAGDKVVITVTAEGYSTITATWTAGGSSSESSETDLVIGNNAINAADVTYAYTATEAGTLNLAAGAAIMGMVEISYTVNGGESTVLELSSNVDLTLAEGDKVVITVTAEGYSSITATWTVGGSSEGGEEETIVGDGSETNPYVISGATTMLISADYYTPVYVKISAGVTVSLDFAAQFATTDATLGTTVTPTEETVYMIVADTMAGAMGQLTATVAGSSEESGNTLVIGDNQIEAADVTFEYTAAEAGTLNLAAGAAIMGMVEISYTVNGGESTVLELSSNVDLMLAEGDKVVITVTAEGYSSITATWTAGGATVSGPVVYVASHSSGRNYQVTVDGNTITVIRSDLTGSLTTGGATTNTGTIAGDTVTLANCTVTLENNVPVQIVWGSATVTGFVQQ